MNILRIFTRIGSLLLRALRFAESRGLTDEIADLALTLVTKAQVQFTDNAARREWVVSELVKKGLPESVARLAVEAGVQAFKHKVAASAP